MPDFATLPIAEPGDAAEFVFGMQGNTAKRFPLNGPTITINPKASGAVITLADILCGWPMVGFEQDATLWTLPTHWQLGIAYPVAAPYKEHAFAVEGRSSLGQVYVNPAQYRGRVANQAAMVALTGTAACDWCSRTDLGNQPFVRKANGADPSLAGSWDAIPLTDLNRPPVDWGTVANDAALTALSAKLDDVATVGSQKLRLFRAPAATRGNWINIETTDKPRIHLLDPNNIAVENKPYFTQLVISEWGNNRWVYR